MVFKPERAEAGLRLANACSALVRRQRGSRASEDSEDAVQDACVRALQMTAPQAVQDPVRYLMRITRNLFIDYRRRRSRDARLFEQAADLAFAVDDRPSPEQLLASKQVLAGILAAIDQLPPRCREAFLMHRFENVSYPVIAHRMGISISMVEKHIAEAMARLIRSQKPEKGFS
jgi:RNA polymerase sigma-70 factor (ECF subfamily)